jgi:hypothetical protein
MSGESDYGAAVLRFEGMVVVFDSSIMLRLPYELLTMRSATVG